MFPSAEKYLTEKLKDIINNITIEIFEQKFRLEVTQCLNKHHIKLIPIDNIQEKSDDTYRIPASMQHALYAVEEFFKRPKFNHVKKWNTLSLKDSDKNLDFSISREQLQKQHNIIKIGRLKSSHIVLENEYCARMHAVIEIENDYVVRIIDLGSSSGTEINGHRVDKNSYLHNLDIIEIGGFKLKLELK